MEERNHEEPPPAAGGGGGGGGWGFSLSVFSDLQKAAEDISRNAVAVAKGIAADLQSDLDSPGAAADPKSTQADPKISESHGAADTDDDPVRTSALDKLERASEDSLLGQGLKVLDNSMETFASGAWQAFGTAWKGSSTLVHKLENSAANLADSIQQSSLPVKASSLAPSIIERGKSFTAKGVEVLERVGKETMDLLIVESGLQAAKNPEEADQQAEFEEVTFDRCFYIYGGPDQLEELEALSSHYALLFNRRKAKLLFEQKSFYDGKLKQIQRLFKFDTDIEEIGLDSDKGKNIESVDDSSGTEMTTLRDSSVSKAADMAAGWCKRKGVFDFRTQDKRFSAALGGIAANEIIQRTTDRLETIHSEGVHRVSELCCFAVSQLLTLGKSIISNTNRSKTEEPVDDNVKIDWPEDSLAKAKIIRSKAQSMSGDVEAVSNSFVTGIADIVEAYIAAAIQSKTSSFSSEKDGLTEQQKSIQEKADVISNHLRADGNTAMGKIRDAVQYLAYVVVSTSIPTPA